MLQDKPFEDARNIEELTEICNASIDIDIVVGAAIKDGNIFRNAALYFSHGKLISQHNKVHLPNYGMFEEARYFKAGDVFESFMLEEKKISMLVCEDLWHKSVHDDLIKENPDLIIALVASPARGFGEDGLDIEKQWHGIIKTVSKECHAKLIFVNRVGFEDRLGFWGGSCILDKKSNILCQLPKYKEIVETFNTEEL